MAFTASRDRDICEAIVAAVACISCEALATAWTLVRVCSARVMARERTVMLLVMSVAYFTTLNGRPLSSKNGL